MSLQIIKPWEFICESNGFWDFLNLSLGIYRISIWQPCAQHEPSQGNMGDFSQHESICITSSRCNAALFFFATNASFFFYILSTVMQEVSRLQLLKNYPSSTNLPKFQMLGCYTHHPQVDKSACISYTSFIILLSPLIYNCATVPQCSILSVLFFYYCATNVTGTYFYFIGFFLLS